MRSYGGPRARVQEGPRLIDCYRRFLRYVYTESGLSIDEALIRERLAVAWTGDGQHGIIWWTGSGEPWHRVQGACGDGATFQST